MVAVLDGEVIGALIAGWDGWRGNMYRLAVRGEHRRKGIGIALVRAGEEYLCSRGARRITALVAFDDGAAGAFWESAGYPRDREIGRRVRNLLPVAGPSADQASPRPLEVALCAGSDAAAQLSRGYRSSERSSRRALRETPVGREEDRR